MAEVREYMNEGKQRIRIEGGVNRKKNERREGSVDKLSLVSILVSFSLPHDLQYK